MKPEFSLGMLAQKLADRELTSVQITQHYLNAIEKENPRLNAYIEVFCDTALAEAKASDSRRAKGKALSPLDGIPIAVKDNIVIKGQITAAASKMLANFVSPYDATVIERIRAAGMPILGRLNMDEFGMGSSTETGFYGEAHNPVDETRTPGGSSGGAAAAVAAGLAPVALGSDTGGSVRQPAALCGVTGVKPAYGTVSRYGLIAFASSLDQIGVIAQSAQDAAMVLDAIGGADPHDATTMPGLYTREACDLHSCTFALPKECFAQELHPEIRSAVLHAADTFAKLGAAVEEISIPLLERALDAYYVISSAEASSNLARYDGLRYGHHAQNCADMDELYRKTRQEGFGLEVKRRILLGTYALSSGYQQQYYLNAQRVREKLTAQMDEALNRYDALIMPVTPTPAWKLGQRSDPMERYLGDIHTVPANLTGLPAVSIPCGKTADGLPIGLGLMAGRTKLGKLLSICRQYEQEVRPDGE